ncbi:glycosyltransferase family 2 protein [Methylobacterium komagatae]|uniref:Glycosyltransferase family 2 protein n=1 Tax=Methylobacterium komagatae TaxID=374425 RepID=A0ABW2BPF6_9HYPH
MTILVSARDTSLGLPPDIAFLLSEGVDGRTLARAAAQARAAGTDAATALLQAGLFDEEGYYRALARTLGLPYLDGPIPLARVLPYPGCLLAGRAPLAPGAGAATVIAPRGQAIAVLLARRGRLAEIALTSPTRLREAVFARMPGSIAARASQDPQGAAASAAAPLAQPLLILGGGLAALALTLVLAPPLPAQALVIVLQALVLALMAFRLAALAIRPPTIEAPPLPDADLPVYTILVPLYRERRSAYPLAKALAALDYPAAKLDIKILIEADDRETEAVLARIPFPARFEVVTVPPGWPRTKPRALNVGLALARGRLLTVYDAEDVPEADQLRKAAALFAVEPPTTACLQGRLVIDDHADGLLPKLFATEYAALFDVLNPALCALDLPVPLGGTTMHLRTDVLRKLGGWDAYNVTEDADLGIRLALAGYRTGDLPSATYEETARGWRRWTGQRTRWLKGYLQTSLVHGRRPLALLSRLGLLGTLSFLALVPGTVASALAYPVCLFLVARDLLTGRLGPAPTLLDNIATGLALTLLVAGFAAMVAPAFLGCRRRGWRDLYKVVLLLPAYFLLVSVAAYRAVAELVRAPHDWTKTDHGLSRSSRSGRRDIGGAQRNAVSSR